MAFTASQAFDLLRTAFSRNRLPHALLIVGDEHQGASRLILQLLELMNGIRADHLDSVRDEYCWLVRPKSSRAASCGMISGPWNPFATARGGGEMEDSRVHGCGADE
ncbi:MAG: hypothetical protein ACLT8C_01175 [Akkermansia muciniphila]